ncbi:M28 family peptidase [bacterium]|nr:M28 family peptidase [bacterium]
MTTASIRSAIPSVLLLLGLLATTVLAVQEAPLRATLTDLTAPELAGRGAGTAGERRAAEMLADWFSEAGLEPTLGDAWLQEVPWSGGSTVNVLGTWPGRGDLAARWLIVGAHIDHLGRVDDASRGVPGPGEYYPGAGDNASGVAVLRALLPTLADLAAPHRSILMVGFGAEEVGLVGSRHLAANLPMPLAQVDAMINLDAVGRLGDGPLHVAGAATSPVFAAPLARLAEEVRVVEHDPLLLGSDHLGFVARDIPSLFLFTDAYPEMNSPADSLAAVDLPGLVRLARMTAELVAALATSQETFAFAAPAEVARPEGGNRATWFGTAPDFSGATASEGYLIGGVADGGPAAAAGLAAGDVIVTIAGRPVADLASFTRELRRHDPGDLVEVEVLRGDKRLDVLVTLGDRADRER